MFCKHFLLLHDLSFCFLNRVFQRADVLNIDKAQFVKFFFYGWCFRGCNPGLFSALSSSYIVMDLTFRTTVHFELIFANLRYGSIFNLASGCSIIPAPFIGLLHLCEKAALHVCVGLFLDCLFCSIKPMNLCS